MEPEEMATANGTKRPIDSENDPLTSSRNKKRLRSTRQQYPPRITPFEPEGAFQHKHKPASVHPKRLSPASVTPELNGNSNSSNDDATTMAVPPSSLMNPPHSSASAFKNTPSRTRHIAKDQFGEKPNPSPTMVTFALENDYHSTPAKDIPAPSTMTHWPTMTSSAQPSTTAEATAINTTTTNNNNKSAFSSKSILSSILLLLICGGCCAAATFFQQTPSLRAFGHIIPPKHALDSLLANIDNNSLHKEQNVQTLSSQHLSNKTLRDFLTDPNGFSLALAPSFFGFYGYFGMLAAWDEGLAIADDNNDKDDGNGSTAPLSFLETNQIKSLAGASAGAMAAMLLAMGIPPRKAADFCQTIDLPTFADPPGIASLFKGDKFEQLMYDFMKSERPHHSMQIQDANVPVAVTGFDLQTMATLVMTKGCVARSARASATFPFLFQPVHWFLPEDDNNSTFKKDYVLIDGGVLDGNGLEGLSVLGSSNNVGKKLTNKQRVVNMVVGKFGGIGQGVPPGPSEMPNGLETAELLSISIRNLPMCGPWAMENGPRAVEAADKAMLASLDLPLYRGQGDGHYELHIDASSFVPP